MKVKTSITLFEELLSAIETQVEPKHGPPLLRRRLGPTCEQSRERYETARSYRRSIFIPTS